VSATLWDGWRERLAGEVEGLPLVPSHPLRTGGGQGGPTPPRGEQAGVCAGKGCGQMMVKLTRGVGPLTGCYANRTVKAGAHVTPRPTWLVHHRLLLRLEGAPGRSNTQKTTHRIDHEPEEPRRPRYHHEHADSTSTPVPAHHTVRPSPFPLLKHRTHGSSCRMRLSVHVLHAPAPPLARQRGGRPACRACVWRQHDIVSITSPDHLTLTTLVKGS
jgi:hypothetical protein